MKLKRITLLVALLFALGNGVRAGIIDTPPAPAPPPEHQAAGIIDTPPSSEAEPSDPTVELALTVLRTALSAF